VTPAVTPEPHPLEHHLAGVERAVFRRPAPMWPPLRRTWAIRWARRSATTGNLAIPKAVWRRRALRPAALGEGLRRATRPRAARL